MEVDQQARALSGIRVLDLTQVMAGAYCSALLADMGADVVKIERPGAGDDTRRMGGVTDPEAAPGFIALNRNKRGLAVDLKTPAGVELVRRLAADADVLVENYRPGALQRLGLGFDDLASINPRLVYCSISGFGTTGPYSDRGGFDLVAQGMSGLMSMTGEPDGAPVKAGVPVCDLNAGIFGAVGVLNALMYRERFGRGQHVDVSLLEAGIATTVWETANWFAAGDVATPLGSAHRMSAPYQAFPTADGWLTIGAANQRTWEKLCSAIGRTDLTEDPRFVDNPTRLRNREALAKEIATTLATDTRAGWSQKLHAAGVPCGPINSIDEVYRDEHVLSREMAVRVDHPGLGPVTHIGQPYKLSHSPSRITRTAPLLGEHSTEVLAESGWSDEEIEHLLDAGVITVPHRAPEGSAAT
ncbi:CoA transferase [Nakamurella sp. YIM 132087]|uniref:CoA transferase n=1 Tax=Nakamurella alba TaxID=2665158 RepID=A0A7K1FHI8_9ACTN|nr:CoA transferase [Nakamurella alba]MTD12334.1 CoA transferase [Nakamurella alba]